MVLASMINKQKRAQGYAEGLKEGRKKGRALAQREAWLNSNLRSWAKEFGIPIEEFPKHYVRAEGFAIGYAKGHERGFEIGYEKGIVAAKARTTLNDKLRVLAKKYGIPEDELPFQDEDN